MRSLLSDLVTHQDRSIRVFVSSTFDDMVGERETLVKRVFPSLRRLCQERGVVWSEVDLRWGITSRDVEEGRVLPICLAEIDRCRPFFIAMLGDRYGTRTNAAARATADLLAWVREYADRSLTELEIRHAVLRGAAPHVARFYFRDAGTTPARRHDMEQLDALKNEIIAAELPVRRYTDLDAFAHVVLDDFRTIIDERFPESGRPTVFEAEARRHICFFASRTTVYVEPRGYFERLDAHLVGSGPPLIVRGLPGAGKTALVAGWLRRLAAGDLAANVVAANEPARRWNPLARLRALGARSTSRLPDVVLVHAAEASESEASWPTMLRRLTAEAEQVLGLQHAESDDAESLVTAFANVLRMLAARSKVLVVIDGVERLAAQTRGRPGTAAVDRTWALPWLPERLPSAVRVVLTARPGPVLDALMASERGPGVAVLDLLPLTAHERETVIAEFLTLYGKRAAPHLIRRIVEAPQTADPLFLRVLAEELRVVGRHDEVEPAAEAVLAGGTTTALFDRLLERLERECDTPRRPGLVGSATRLLWASRNGLTESELLTLLGTSGGALPALVWSPLYLGLIEFLSQLDGRLMLAHKELANAVARRYVPSDAGRRSAHLELAAFFATQPLAPAVARELPWHLAKAGEWARLYEVLADPSFASFAWALDTAELKRNWSLVEEHSPFRLVDAYRAVIDEPHAHADEAWNIALLLRQTGHPRESLAITQALVMLLRSGRDERARRDALGNAAIALRGLGQHERALALLREQEDGCRQHNDLRGLQTTLGNQAVLLRDLERYDEALAKHEEERRLCEALGDRHARAVALLNTGAVYAAMHREREATRAVSDAERAFAAFGDAMGLQAVLEARGRLLQNAGKRRQAVECYREREALCRELRYLSGELASVLAQAGLISELGGFDQAMKLVERVKSSSRAAGDHAAVVDSLTLEASLYLRVSSTASAARSALDVLEEASRLLDLDRQPGQRERVNHLRQVAMRRTVAG